MEKITGTIEKVFFASCAFSAGLLKIASNERISFAGCLRAEIGQTISVLGEWRTHPKFGKQFQIETLESTAEISVEGLANYLAMGKKFAGIGPVKAARIAALCGSNFEMMLFESPERLLAEVPLTLAQVETLQIEWRAKEKFNATITALAAWGLTKNQIDKIIGVLGNAAPEILKENPYQLVDLVPGMGFKKIDEISLQMKVDKNLPARIQQGIIYVLKQALQDGHCYCDFFDLVEKANKELFLDVLEAESKIKENIDILKEDGRVHEDYAEEKIYIALPEIYRAEMYLKNIFDSYNKFNVHFPSEYKTSANDLNTGQTDALQGALENQICVISGPAGSGKSYLLKSLCKEYWQRGKQIALCAPTGRAARRMTELTGREASTIHRLLNYNGKQFLFNENKKLDVDVVIMDETSMAESILAYRLFLAIDFERTALVLVGDHNQLPPVGPGNLLRDLINTRRVPCFILDQIVRQAGILKHNCNAILKGIVEPTSTELIDNLRPWYVFDKFAEPAELRDFIEKLFNSLLEKVLGENFLDKVQLITPRHDGPIGRRELNILLQRLIQKKFYGIEVLPPKENYDPKPLLHDRVMQIKNDYDLGVMNGTLGIIFEENEDEFLINFEGFKCAIKKGSEQMRNIQVAFANTIHKLQGSEFPFIILILHKSHSYQLNRNLCYTGVTRSQQSIMILGDQWGIKKAVEKNEIDLRRTFLSFSP